MMAMTPPITEEQLTALISEAGEWAEIYEHPIHNKPQRDFFEGMVRALTAYLAVLTAEPAKCWHINLDCDDGKAVCLHCGKTWEV
ncbi:hypothetical protein RIN60_05810 [Kluyvera cryocrescens]|uniref:hypothetical protein n=1 Tax=Kluyvera cryocrescens TaxID=580 RepID=UPI0028BE9855|nr:hypothetical protein [Kluyvera cryocrescens]WNN72864.1 hypothetical protein RIN60_05810 [Kluyvera cryocrescens]